MVSVTVERLEPSLVGLTRMGETMSVMVVVGKFTLLYDATSVDAAMLSVISVVTGVVVVTAATVASPVVRVTFI
jgi:hypothetical protein